MKLALALVLMCGCGARTELDATHIGQDASRDAACGGSRTITLSIPATTPWTDTGIDVDSATRVVIHAQGIVRYGPMPAQTQGADGVNFDGQQFFSTAVLPSAVIISLIGKVGSTPVPEGKAGDGAGFVGANYDEVMTTSGRLFLGYNDQVGQFGDNSGAFTVTITTTDAC